MKPAIASHAAGLLIVACLCLPGLGCQRQTPARDAAAAGEVPITTSSEEARSAYLEGRSLQESLRGTDAHQHFQRAVELDPELALAHLGVAQTSPTAARFFAALERAVSVAGTASEGEQLLVRALSAGVNGNPDAQRQALERLVELYPSDPRAHNQLGIYLLGRQEWAGAAAEYRKAIELDPEFSQPYNQLGYALRFLTDYDGAERAFTRYIELLPGEPNPYDSYGELLMKTGRFTESIETYRKALEVDPHFVPSFVGISLDQMYLGDYDRARGTLDELEAIARTDGERRQACTWRAAAWLHQREYDRALEEIARRREIAAATDDRPAMAADLNLMGNILLAAGRPADALARFEESVQMTESADVSDDIKEAARRNHHFDAGRVALAEGDVDRAAGLATAYLEAADPHQVPFELWQQHHLAGLVAIERGDLESGAAELDQANPQDPRVLYALAQVQARLGDRETALATAHRAADFNGLSFNLAYVRSDARDLVRRLTES